MTDGSKPPAADGGRQNPAPLVFLVVVALLVFSAALTWNVSLGLDQMPEKPPAPVEAIVEAPPEPAVQSPEAALERLAIEGAEEIQFSPNSLGASLLTSGWFQPEDGGVWISGGGKGSLLAPADVAGVPVTSLRFDFVAFAPPTFPQTFRFSINGQEVGRASVAPREGTMIPGSSVTLPAPAVSDASPLHIEIEVERPISPADAGVGPDGRKLGFRLSRIVLNPPPE